MRTSELEQVVKNYNSRLSEEEINNIIYNEIDRAVTEYQTKKSELIIVTLKYKDEIKAVEPILEKLGFANKVTVVEKLDQPLKNAMSIILNDIEVYIPMEGLIDIEEERKRLEAEVTRLEGEVVRGEKMLSNPGFVNKAPEAKVNEEKAKLANYKEMLETAKERLASL